MGQSAPGDFSERSSVKSNIERLMWWGHVRLDMKKMKAVGDNGATFGLAVDSQYYLQTLYPSGDWGEVSEVQEGGQFGWQHWVSAHDAYEIETFPAGCGLLQSETLMG